MHLSIGLAARGLVAGVLSIIAGAGAIAPLPAAAQGISPSAPPIAWLRYEREGAGHPSTQR